MVKYAKAEEFDFWILRDRNNLFKTALKPSVSFHLKREIFYFYWKYYFQKDASFMISHMTEI